MQNELYELLEILKALYQILNSEDHTSINYITQTLPKTIALTDSAIAQTEIKKQIILTEVKETCNSFFPPHGGLTDYFIWRDDFEERQRVNELYDSYKKRLWSLLDI